MSSQNEEIALKVSRDSWSARAALTLFLVLPAAVWATACDHHDARHRALLDSLKTNHSCSSTLPPASAARVELARADICALVGVAMETFRRASGATPSLPRADTTRVSEARVTVMSEIDSTGALVDAWWVVTLELPSNIFNAEVRISQSSGRESIRPVHKPITSA